MKTPFNDLRAAAPVVDPLSRPPPPVAEVVPVSPTGVYSLAADGKVYPAADRAEFRPHVVRHSVIAEHEVITLFLPMRMAGNTFFEVSVSTRKGALLHIERQASQAQALKRHEALLYAIDTGDPFNPNLAPRKERPKP